MAFSVQAGSRISTTSGDANLLAPGLPNHSPYLDAHGKWLEHVRVVGDSARLACGMPRPHVRAIAEPRGQLVSAIRIRKGFGRKAVLEGALKSSCRRGRRHHEGSHEARRQRPSWSVGRPPPVDSPFNAFFASPILVRSTLTSRSTRVDSQNRDRSQPWADRTKQMFKRKPPRPSERTGSSLATEA